ncbi:hypothetical protein E2C01_051549 [Portunus trituberculatus]|uniref:Uncharacterized protein n=1 Tax=Portunus trituberculatus TaxID=210409 RepID=A0A5B7GJ10_PORTR|nr:hypothetical protein [Portunus trituberculatus]
MVVAHSRPPNHTGGHSHLNTTSDTVQSTAPLCVVTQQGGNERKTRENAAKSATFSPGTTKPVAPHSHGQTSSKPATPKGGHNSQTETVEHPEQPSHTTQHCARKPRARVSISAKSWLGIGATPARPSETAGTKSGWPRCRIARGS